MPNLTVSLDRAVIKAAKVYAAVHGTSISRIVREHLAEITGFGPRPSTSGDPLVRFSRDDIGRKEAMAALGVDYGALIGMMAERRLPLPELPKKETDAMAAAFERIMQDAGG